MNQEKENGTHKRKSNNVIELYAAASRMVCPSFFLLFLSPLFPGIHNEMHRGETEVFLFVMLIH